MRKIKLFLSLLMVMLLSVGNVWASFSKATSIAAGDVVAFVCEGTKMDLTSISSTSTPYGIGTSYTTSPACTWTFTVEAGSAEGSYAFKSGNNYLSWSSGNSLTTSTTKNANSSWTVVIEDGHATITNVNTTNRVIWWNVSSPRFACYTSKSDGTGYKYVQIYKQDGSTPAKTLSSVAVSGAPTKKSYTTGDNFDPAGLTVTGTYSDESTAPITSGITWSYDPSQVLALNQTSIGVIATVNEIASPKFTVTGLTVTEAPVAANYELVTDVNDLAAGDEIIIVNNGATKAISTTQANNNRPAANVTAKDNVITPGDDVQILTLGITNEHWTLYTGDGYLYASSNSSNQLKTQTTNNANGEWTIVISNDVATLTAQGSNSRNVMQYNSGSDIFACYGSASQTSLKIFKKAGAPAAVAKPTISGDENAIISGNYFVDAIEVTITKTGEGEIYYTTDGKTPTAASEHYTGPFWLDKTATVKAIVIKGEESSEIAEKEFIYFAVVDCATARIAALSVSENNEVYKEGEVDVFTIRGYVTNMDKYSESNYFWIADEQGTSKVLEVYKPSQKGTGDLALNQAVEVTGKLTKYNTTPEFAYGCTFEILADGITTSVDNTVDTKKAVKFIENGQLFIELNGHIYNVQGQTVK